MTLFYASNAVYLSEMGSERVLKVSVSVCVEKEIYIRGVYRKCRR